jgi:GDPmannose 4,6-dehydratase
MILQQDTPDDYVLATGESHSVREFIEIAFAYVGRPIEWTGRGADEMGRCAKSGDVLIAIDPRYFRPTEVPHLLGDPTKARSRLGWRHSTTFPQLVHEMVDADRLLVHRERFYNA